MSQVDFKTALGRQLGFVNRSCQSFDAGFHDEAIRIAQGIRVIMHDTKKQKSVLAHLGAKNIMLTSACLDIASKMADLNSPTFGLRPQMFNGMGRFSTGPRGTQYFPKLGEGMFRYDLPVDTWWTQTIFILDPDTQVSRHESLAGRTLTARDFTQSDSFVNPDMISLSLLLRLTLHPFFPASHAEAYRMSNRLVFPQRLMV